MKWFGVYQVAFVGMLALPGLAGCGAPTTVGPTKALVSGQVTLDQKPVQNGQIIFTDVHCESPRQYAGAIVDGKYELESTPGEKRVEISARVSAGPETDPGTNQRETIPNRYNTNSTLKANIGDEKEEGLDFQLTSESNPK